MSGVTTAASQSELDVSGVPNYVGTAFRYFSRIGVVAVSVDAGCAIRRGDVLQFGTSDEKHFRSRATSLQVSHNPVDKVEGIVGVGIKVCKRVDKETPVFVIVPDPE